MGEKQATILHIEDNESNRILVRKVLEREGYRILEAFDGMEGFEMAQQKPDLILMDINIPGLDGMELSTKIKSIEHLKHVPIIAITANVMKGDREKSLIAGCDGYIPKPIDTKKFPQQIKTYLEGKKESVQEEEKTGLLKQYSERLVARLEEKVLGLEKANSMLMESNEDLVRSNNLLKQTQNQLIQSEKMSSIGRFAATIIHEIRNPLSNILGHSDILKMMLQKKSLDEKKTEEYLNIISNQSNKIEDFIKELLYFSKKIDEEFSEGSFNAIIERVLAMIKKDIRYPGVSIETELQDKRIPISCNESRIEQVLVNLVNNAKYAVIKKFGSSYNENKKIILKTGEEKRGDSVFASCSVIDHGTGIGQEKISHIFEPFFTTKPKEEGTGLGLSVCYTIIEDHKGTIEVKSEIDQYTEFTILIPVKTD